MGMELKITGMSCTHCERAVQQALAAVPGVTAVRVDHASGSATVEGNADLAELQATVAAEGYQAAPAGAAG